MTSPDVVIFGSLNVDLILSVAHHPKPGETVLCRSSDLKPGGKGANQAVAAARAGARVAMTGCIGKDALGTLLLQALEAEAVNSAGIVQTSDAITGCASIAVSSDGENLIYVASGANALARADMVPPGQLAGAKVAMCQMEVSVAETWLFLERAKAAGARTILNLAPAPELSPSDLDALSANVDVLVLNEEEARQLLAQVDRAPVTGAPEAIAVRLASGLKTICVTTLGSAGAIAADGRQRWAASSLPVQVVDTTGAGDTFAGVLAALLADAADFGEALTLAAAGASLACEKPGAQDGMPYRKDILSAIGR
jgi:ribokinase